MTSSIPDGFSIEQLQSMHEEAIPEAVAHAVELTQGCDHPEDETCPHCSTSSSTFGPNNLSVEQICDISHAALEEINDAVRHPIGHKVAAIAIITNMLEWHSRTAAALMEDGDYSPALGWARDAGKFQAILNILDTVEVCDDDFTVPNNQGE